MPLPRVRRHKIAAQLLDGAPITIYSYCADTPLIASWEHEVDSARVPVLITVDGDLVEWREHGVYYLPATQQVITSTDPGAP